MDSSLLIFLFSIVFVSVILSVFVKASKKLKKEQAFFKSAGFAPCPAEKAEIEKKVNALAHTGAGGVRLGSYQIVRPLKLSGGGKTVYCYTKTQQDATSTNRSSLGHGEFLFPVDDDNSRQIAIYFEMAHLPKFMDAASTKILSYTVGPDFEKIEIPKMLEGRGILAAFGRPGSSLYDLVNQDTLEKCLRGRDIGIYSFICGGGMAEISYMSQVKNSDIAAIWALVRDIAGV